MARNSIRAIDPAASTFKRVVNFEVVPVVAAAYVTGDGVSESGLFFQLGENWYQIQTAMKPAHAWLAAELNNKKNVFESRSAPIPEEEVDVIS